MFGLEPGAVERPAGGERIVGDPQCCDVIAEGLVELGAAFDVVEPFLDRFEVGEREFEFDDAEVFERVGRPGHVVVVVGTDNDTEGPLAEG